MATSDRTDATAVATAAATAAATAVPLPGDPQFPDQWYLQNTGQSGGTPGMDIDVVPAWNVATGQGVTIVVDDTGIDYTNPDIAPNYDAATSVSLDPPYTNGYPTNDLGLTGSALTDLAHGTWVTGLIAAANNNTGIVGVAYNATVSAFRVFDTVANEDNPWGSIQQALLNSANFDIANNSWEFTSPLSDSVFNPDAENAITALLTAAETGRGGLGTINVFAAGNYYQSGDDTNLHAFQSSINGITVAALDDNGTVNAPGGRYSTAGATILVSAPGTGIISDTIVGDGNVAGDDDLESGLDGTSFATPLVSGVIALMLQANPNLGLRDVQEILAYTARQTDPTDPTWHTNDAVNWNGGGLLVSNDYGFGLVDAAAAVELARSWTLQQTANNRTVDTVAAADVGAIAATGTSYSFNVTANDSLTLQWVRVQVSFEFSAFDNLKLTLTSPGGASSVLLDQPNDGIGGFFDNTVQLSSDQFWGQGSTGTWTLTATDANPALGTVGQMFSATLVLVGDPPVTNTTFIYTDEYGTAAAADPSRETLNDPSGGFDTLNLAAVSTACVINLVPGGVGSIGGTPFTIGAGTTVTVVYTGIGADTIDVNGDTNIITSEGGVDTVVFPGVLASYTLDRSGSEATVTQGDVTDILNDITTLQFADQSVAVATIACFAAGTRILTVRGELPVESLRAGDLLPVVHGVGALPVVWLGHRRVDCRRHPKPQDVRPVCIRAGAFGVGMPHRDLRLSPDHAVFIDGKLIPIRYLINGTTIAQEPRDEITYWHVELRQHDVILAEGLPCESYLDTGNRSSFANDGDAGDGEGAAPGDGEGAAPTVLHPDFARLVWRRSGCAELVLKGRRVARVKRRLLARAAALGHATTREPALHLLVDGRVRQPEIIGRVYRFHLPAIDCRIRLVSRTAIPAFVRADSVDHRQLGVAVSCIRLDGHVIPLTDARLRSGWHEVESTDAGTAWRWTDGAAALDLSGARTLEVTLLPLLRYWAAAPKPPRNRATPLRTAPAR
jgi:subtilisin family serine protease